MASTDCEYQRECQSIEASTGSASTPASCATWRMNSTVAPRPIGWISSRDKGGNVNLAPYSFFNAFNYTPPIVGFASIGYKDTLRNIEETGEFVWNLATRPLAEAMPIHLVTEERLGLLGALALAAARLQTG